MERDFKERARKMGKKLKHVHLALKILQASKDRGG